MQEKAVALLEEIFQKLTFPTVPPAPLLRRLFSKPSSDAVKGLYLWGDVGRGKSMVMELFVQAIKPLLPIKRIHFHAFMLDVHKRMHAFRAVNASVDVMPQLIQDLAPEQRVLCLDEFEVHDVADASILARLFSGLFSAGICVIFTSNRAPRALYPNGLQREQFLNFIDNVLTPNCTVFALNSKEDYRLKQLSALHKIYVYPRNSESDSFLMHSWELLTHHAESDPLKLEVNGRILQIDKHANGVAWLTFNELCMRPLGASDYLELAQVVHTLLLQGIPKLAREQRNEARRFVMLIDALYDHRIKCLFTAETPPDHIYEAGDGSFEFARTISRLNEMQSANYLAQTKRQA